MSTGIIHLGKFCKQNVPWARSRRRTKPDVVMFLGLQSVWQLANAAFTPGHVKSPGNMYPGRATSGYIMSTDTCRWIQVARS